MQVPSVIDLLNSATTSDVTLFVVMRMPIIKEDFNLMFNFGFGYTMIISFNFFIRTIYTYEGYSKIKDVDFHKSSGQS